jgi:hypothetical protein
VPFAVARLCAALERAQPDETERNEEERRWLRNGVGLRRVGRVAATDIGEAGGEKIATIVPHWVSGKGLNLPKRSVRNRPQVRLRIVIGQSGRPDVDRRNERSVQRPDGDRKRV